jgi:hypothetical protein
MSKFVAESRHSARTLLLALEWQHLGGFQNVRFDLDRWLDPGIIPSKISTLGQAQRWSIACSLQWAVW